MKYKCPLIAVADIQCSKAFYRDVLGLRVVSDFGENVVLTGGLALQTIESWCGFLELPASNIHLDGKDHELYFEENDFDGFLKRLSQIHSIRYVHPPKRHNWGQRVVRFYDPDGHIIEVGETMETVCRRFAGEGKTPEEISKITMLPVRAISRMLKTAHSE
ncbi:MAG: VOC family protein [Christensenella sp.]|nr:VOC family protein [Christensenella sp.]